MRPIVSIALGVACGGGVIDTASGQSIVREWVGTSTSSPIGHEIASLPDVDGDGVPEVAYLTVIFFSVVEVRSGATGALLYTLPSAIYEISPLADFDGDGVAEIGTSSSHGIDVYSGVDGALLYAIPLTVFDLVPAAASLRDLDGDGIDDLVLGVPATSPRAPGPGEVKVRSGATGAALFAAIGGTTADEFGSGIAPLHDVDGDGKADCAAGAPNGLVPALGSRVGYVRACSGAHGATLWQFDGSASFPRMGRRLAPTGDHDGDGEDDLLVASGGDGNGASSGRVTIVSSASGLEIAHFDGAAGDDIAIELADAGDVDGDGARDLLLSTQADQAWLVSGKTLSTLYTFEDVRGASTGARVAKGRDYDLDGRADVVLSDPDVATTGFVSIHRGNDLFLDVTPIDVTDGDAIAATIRTGIPGNLGLLALVELNGTAVFVAVNGIVQFDATGSIAFADTVPPGLAGDTFVFQAFALDARSKVITSDREAVTVR